VVCNEMRAFVLMRAIENALRELVVEELSATFGQKWHRTQMPEDVAQKYRDAITVERRYSLMHLVPHHPIYYIDFPDLKKIITRNDNWTNAFQAIFGRNKDVILSMFAELEPLRNAIAHNRTLSTTSVRTIEDASDGLRTALGAQRFDSMAGRSTVAPDVHEILCNLRWESQVASNRIRHCTVCVPLDVWQQTAGLWWFEENYLGSDLSPIRAFFELAKEYRALPRSMGDGYRVERWLAERRFEQLFELMDSSWRPLKIPEQKL
jgi:hypothetical protein